jgi:hypothetical protein
MIKLHSEKVKDDLRAVYTGDFIATNLVCDNNLKRHEKLEFVSEPA